MEPTRLRHTDSPPAVRLPGAVERGVVEHESGWPRVEFAYRIQREALPDARGLEVALAFS
jgi:hypothetical protein